MTELRGAPPAVVRDALEREVSLPGGTGFAGRLDDQLVRDVLGREPVFFERAEPETWGFDPAALSEPVSLPGGHVHDGRTDRAVWTLPDPGPDPAEEALQAVRAAVLASVGDVDPEGLAVAFSGGLDSSLVATGVPDAPLYVAGFDGCHDVAAARTTAAAMGREADLEVVEVTHESLRRAARAVAQATGRTNAMDVSIAVPLYLVAERVASDGYGRLAVGQGADELFGGYAKLVDPGDDSRIDADTVRGARRETVLTLPGQLERDVLTLRAAGVDPVAPFLRDRVVASALRLPSELIVTDADRKVGLRRAAHGVVPTQAQTADKKAVQYGTYVSRELDRLARQAGFKRRMDDHVTRYVESLL